MFLTIKCILTFTRIYIVTNPAVTIHRIPKTIQAVSTDLAIVTGVLTLAVNKAATSSVSSAS